MQLSSCGLGNPPLPPFVIFYIKILLACKHLKYHIFNIIHNLVKYCQYSFTQTHFNNVIVLIGGFNGPPTYTKEEVHQAFYIRCKTKPSLLQGKCGRIFWRNRKVVSFFQYNMPPICQNIIILIISYYNLHHISVFMSPCWISIKTALRKVDKQSWQ